MGAALDGVRIIDFSRMYSGPFCTMLLAELGAEVIKVEIPDGGDAVRTIPPQTGALEGYIFTILNRNKKSITLNLKSKKGQAIAREFISKFATPNSLPFSSTPPANTALVMALLEKPSSRKPLAKYALDRARWKQPPAEVLAGAQTGHAYWMPGLSIEFSGNLISSPWW